ncbi:MAG TPA: hypothetical protein VFG69_21400, partial [Nannocystaceae bacterium]|nr:hypothetical protein [Nannocystaceae bacterium]
MVGRTMVVVMVGALGCSPDSEKVGELDTEASSTGPDGDSDGVTGPGGGTTADSVGTSGGAADTEGVAESTGEPGTTGGAQVDACEFPQGPE